MSFVIEPRGVSVIVFSIDLLPALSTAFTVKVTGVPFVSSVITLD